MSVNITIGTQVITFPESGAAPNWAPAITQFAQAVATQLSGIASAFDIPPSVQVLTSDVNTNLPVNNCVFPNGSVRSFSFEYGLYRTNGVTSLAENGTVNVIYNTLTSNWSLEHEFQGTRQANGSPYHTFSMSGDQLTITTIAIGGSYDSVNSTISYAAKTILTTDI